MDLQYVPVRYYEKAKSYACPHNEGCACSVKQCHRCGWHPKVAKARMEKLGIRKEDQL